MAHKRNKKSNWKNISFTIAVIILIILIFSFFDYLVHSLKDSYSVPSYYFKDKIIFGIIWGLIVYFVIIKRISSLAYKSIAFSALISIILQVRYAYEGYPINFVVLFLFIHFFIIWIIAYLGFRIINKGD